MLEAPPLTAPAFPVRQVEDRGGVLAFHCTIILRLLRWCLVNPFPAAGSLKFIFPMNTCKWAEVQGEKNTEEFDPACNFYFPKWKITLNDLSISNKNVGITYGHVCFSKVASWINRELMPLLMLSEGQMLLIDVEIVLRFSAIGFKGKSTSPEAVKHRQSEVSMIQLLTCGEQW